MKCRLPIHKIRQEGLFRSCGREIGDPSAFRCLSSAGRAVTSSRNEASHLLLLHIPWEARRRLSTHAGGYFENLWRRSDSSNSGKKPISFRRLAIALIVFLFRRGPRNELQEWSMFLVGAVIVAVCAGVDQSRNGRGPTRGRGQGGHGGGGVPYSVVSTDGAATSSSSITAPRSSTSTPSTRTPKSAMS